MIKLNTFKKDKNYSLRLGITFLVGLAIGILYYGLPYEISIDNEVVGVVKGNEKSIVEKYIYDIEQKHEKILNKDVEIKNNIEYKKLFSFEELQSLDIAKNRIDRKLQFSMDAYSINVDDKNLVYLSDKKYADEILENIKSAYEYNINNEEVEKLGFVENVKVLGVITNINNIISKESGLKYFLTGNESFKKYIVNNNFKNKTFSSSKLIILENENENKNENENLIKVSNRNMFIASRGKSSKNNDIDTFENEETINKLSSENYIGINPILNVEVIKTIITTEDIEYEIEYQNSSDLYKGVVKTKSDGINGKKEVTYNIKYINGKEIERELISENVITKPTSEIVLKGTSEEPKIAKIFIKPASGIITSKYGLRNSGFHRGLDIANDIGTSIYAAHEGKVIFSGWHPTYGNLIKIDHNNGYITYYAHNNKLLVVNGEIVTRGQKISEMGDTGKVTGPHLHFEVIKNGNTLNPINYIEF